MKRILYILTIVFLFSCSNKTKYFKSKKTELITKWDTIRPLSNPNKGWYHHFYDNGIGKYLINEDKDLLQFTGMDHLYIRLAWAFLEPEEGVYNWSYIDDIVKKYVPLGYGISFRITCKETKGAPNTVPFEIDGISYATPYWVSKAGAKGIKRPKYGSASWLPDWDDPIFLTKLSNFHKAFAKRYDGKPWVRYIDVGSIGEWGEGHTYFSSKIPPSIDEIKLHLDLYTKHYKKTQLVLTDDLIAYEKTDLDIDKLYQYAKEKGFTWRDDSPMVEGYMRDYFDSWTVSHPHFFENIYKIRPTVFELEHYNKVKKNGFWIGKDGKDIIPDYKISGAEVFKEAMALIRPTYIGFHGYVEEWFKDNPNLTGELLNMCGYWYFPKSITLVKYEEGHLFFNMEWYNKGVAPAYNSYALKGKLIPLNKSKEVVVFEIENSGNKQWMPNKIAPNKYSVSIGANLKGDYELAIQLFDDASQKPVEIGLKLNSKKDNYFVLQNLKF